MKTLLGKLHPDTQGATLVEYGLIVGLIAIVCIAAVALLGTNLNTLFTGLAPQI